MGLRLALQYGRCLKSYGDTMRDYTLTPPEQEEMIAVAIAHYRCGMTGEISTRARLVRAGMNAVDIDAVINKHRAEAESAFDEMRKD